MRIRIVLLLALAVSGCDPSSSQNGDDETDPLLGAKADQACDPDAGMLSVHSDATGDDSTGDDALLANESDSAELSDGLDPAETDTAVDENAPELIESAEEGMSDEELADDLMQPNPCEAAVPFVEAYEVNLHLISIPAGTEAPTYVGGKSEDGKFGMSGTEYWQKWPGGENPLFGYYGGTDAGKLCMHASARRFDAIMAVAPESLRQLLENSNWGGRFFNWNDDFSNSSYSTGQSARLWAWRTSLVKWISQTNGDGTCYLPTLAMVEALASNCADRAANYDGEIKGCTN